jgi:hypothetical protein
MNPESPEDRHPKAAVVVAYSLTWGSLASPQGFSWAHLPNFPTTIREQLKTTILVDPYMELFNLDESILAAYFNMTSYSITFSQM